MCDHLGISHTVFVGEPSWRSQQFTSSKFTQSQFTSTTSCQLEGLLRMLHFPPSLLDMPACGIIARESIRFSRRVKQEPKKPDALEG